MPSAITVAAVVIALWLLYKNFSSGNHTFWMNKKLKSILMKDQENIPTHLPCNIPSPDGALFCRLEIGHAGWHSHHGPISWYLGQWAEDDHPDRYGNIPW